MQQLITEKIENMGGISCICSCGKKHELRTKRIVYAAGGLKKIAEIANEIMPLGRILVIGRASEASDALESAQDILAKAGYNLVVHCYGEEDVCGLEEGGQLFQYPEDIRLAVAVGDTAILNIAKYFASVQNIPVVCVPTCCDCGETLAESARIYVGDMLYKFRTANPYGVIYDLDILLGGARSDTASSFGDNLAGYLTLVDVFFASCIRGQKYCVRLFETAERLLERNLENWESLARGERAAALVNLECTVRLSVLKQIAPEFGFGAADAAAGAFEMLMHAKNRMTKKFGETKFYLAKKLIGLYELLTKNRIRDLSFPPDKGLRADIIDQTFHIGRFEALRRLDYVIDEAVYQMDILHFEEYREDLYRMTQRASEKLELALKGFKRISSDLGYSVMRHVNTADLKLAIGLAPDIFSEYTPLTYFRDMGMLDSYLK